LSFHFKHIKALEFSGAFLFHTLHFNFMWNEESPETVCIFAQNYCSMTSSFLFISGGEIMVVFLIALLLFGSKAIPDIARTLGKGLREFKKATNEIQREINSTTSDFNREVEDIRSTVKREANRINEDINKVTEKLEEEGNKVIKPIEDTVKNQEKE